MPAMFIPLRSSYRTVLAVGLQRADQRVGRRQNQKSATGRWFPPGALREPAAGLARTGLGEAVSCGRVVTAARGLAARRPARRTVSDASRGSAAVPALTAVAAASTAGTESSAV